MPRTGVSSQESTGSTFQLGVHSHASTAILEPITRRPKLGVLCQELTAKILQPRFHSQYFSCRNPEPAILCQESTDKNFEPELHSSESIVRNVHEESPQPAFHSKESRQGATASNPEPRNHGEEWYPLQGFRNQYFLVSNDGAIGVFANYAIVRSCSEMQVLDFRNNSSTRKRNSTTSRTFPVFSPQQVLRQPKTKITAHISYWYCLLC